MPSEQELTGSMLAWLACAYGARLAATFFVAFIEEVGYFTRELAAPPSGQDKEKRTIHFIFNRIITKNIIIIRPSDNCLLKSPGKQNQTKIFGKGGRREEERLPYGLEDIQEESRK